MFFHPIGAEQTRGLSGGPDRPNASADAFRLKVKYPRQA